MQKIDSAHNETFRKLLGLTSAKGLKKEKLFLLSGEKLIGECLSQSNLTVRYEILTAKLKPLAALERRQPDIRRLQLSPVLFDQIDVLGTHFNILVLDQPEIASVKNGIASYKPRGIEVVLPVGDPGNLGALLRSCEAFGVPRVILTEEAAHPFLPKAVKASAGSALRVPLLRGPALRAFPDTSIALDMDGTTLDSFKWPVNGFLIVGEEGQGLGKQGAARFQSRVRIPTTGVQSLNAVVAASIALAHKASARA